MKKVDTSKIIAGVRRLGAVKDTLDHLQESFIDAIAGMMTGFAGSSGVTTLYGCVNSGGGSVYNISLGNVYYNGEVYEVPAFSGTAGGGQVPVLSLQTTWRAGDPVKYSDGTN